MPMERMNNSAELELLHRANHHFARFFERVSSAAGLPPDEELRALLQLHRTLESVGMWFDGRLQTAISDELCHALDRYRQNLLRLRSQLAGMQQSAIANRERLDQRLQHLNGAKAWCAVSRTLI